MEQVSEYIEKIEMLIRLKCLTPKKDDYGDENCYIAASSQHEEVCEHLKKIPPVDFAPFLFGQWVAASEKLPITMDPVIVTWVNHNPVSCYASIKDKPFIGVAHYWRGKWSWYSSTSDDYLSEYGEGFDPLHESIEVIAWQPLPQPYMAKRDDEEQDDPEYDRDGRPVVEI